MKSIPFEKPEVANYNASLITDINEKCLPERIQHTIHATGVHTWLKVKSNENVHENTFIPVESVAEIPKEQYQSSQFSRTLANIHQYFKLHDKLV